MSVKTPCTRRQAPLMQLNAQQQHWMPSMSVADQNAIAIEPSN
ncbi:MAG: hypothetical protein ACAF41_23480 [Leptolyngbya sp. BL-A-14]